MHWLLNLTLGVLPAAALAVSIASGTVDDRHHRRVFLLVYGLWAITLAMWNWMRSAPMGWTILWSVAGVGALAALVVGRYSRRPDLR